MSRRSRRRNPLNRISGLVSAMIVIALVALAARDAAEACDTTRTEPAGFDNSEALLNVVTNPDLPQSIVDYGAFLVSFNPSAHEPNWVSWELTADETVGKVKRYDKFASDPNVEGSAEKWDYSYSGYDRGHMAPAGDMKWSADAMKKTFFMTNICPQAKSLNTGPWKRLEEKCRQWARADSAIIIICGPVLTDTIRERIGDSGVLVPRRFFKVILAPFARPMRGIGFVMPNGSLPGGIQKAAMSIDKVEEITGHDFFSSLPDSIEAAVESQNDFHYWSTIR